MRKNGRKSRLEINIFLAITFGNGYYAAFRGQHLGGSLVR